MASYLKEKKHSLSFNITYDCEKWCNLRYFYAVGIAIKSKTAKRRTPAISEIDAILKENIY